MDTPLDSWLLNQMMKWIHQIEIIIFFMSPQTIDRRDLGNKRNSFQRPTWA